MPSNDFSPPYCPRPTCKFHHGYSEKKWSKKGRVTTQKPPHINYRFQCDHCCKLFSSNTFSLEYRQRKTGLFKPILQCSTQGMSNRSIARNLELAESSVRGKLKHLSRQALLFWEDKMKHLQLKEAVAYDGFESFVYSQFDPNNINHAVGQRSLFLYDFSYSHLNRKGRMTKIQKIKLRNIEEKKGRYPTNRIRVGTRDVLRHLNSRVSERKVLKLVTDEHKSYQQVLRFDLKGHHFLHQMISSRECRNGKNPLFPINHLDMKLRHFLKSCTRETIGFNKNEMGLVDRYILLGLVKNFMRTKFIKGNRKLNIKSPAMVVGICDKILGFDEVFKVRRTRYQVKLRSHWQRFYTRVIECTRLPCVAYHGA